MVGDGWSKFAALALSSLALLVATSSAGAEGDPEEGGFNSFTLKASNGYKMTVLGFSQTDYEEGAVLVYLRRGNAAVLYQTPATVTARRINPDLDRLGEIDVEFRSSGAKGQTAPR